MLIGLAKQDVVIECCIWGDGRPTSQHADRLLTGLLVTEIADGVFRMRVSFETALEGEITSGWQHCSLVDRMLHTPYEELRNARKVCTPKTNSRWCVPHASEF